jgi:predicted dehydrogenase
MQQKLRLGLIGGGIGAFIGNIHRIASRMDGRYELVCGAFSSTPEKSLASGLELELNKNRIYSTYQQLFEAELLLPEAERMQVVSIVTPNHLHFEPTKMALKSGFHVILDKPLCFNLEEAFELQKMVSTAKTNFCLTHTYTGYPMIKQAKQMIANGEIGNVRKVYVSYVQGWLASALENENQKQASWRTNPSQSGIAGAMGDIGTHAFNLAEYVSGLQVTSLCAQINTVIPNRKLDDDGATHLQFNNGATGILVATQIATGAENNITIKIYGDTGSIEWEHENNNSLKVNFSDKPSQIYRSGTAYLHPIASANCRTPAGHPEGYIEAFANIYNNFAKHTLAQINNTAIKPYFIDYPGIEDGVRGMQFIEAVIKSGKSEEKWVGIS